MRGTIAGGATILAAAMLPLSAMGATGTPRAVQQGYGGVAAASHSLRVPAVQASRRGVLPFTGVDLGLAVAGGGGLLLLGGALKRAGERT